MRPLAARPEPATSAGCSRVSGPQPCGAALTRHASTKAGTALPLPARPSPTATSSGTRNTSSPLFLVTARDRFERHAIVEEVGLVSAADVRSKNIVKDVLSAISGLVGGETTYYSHLLNETCEAAMDKLVAHAKSLGADGLVCVRLEATSTMNRLIVGLHTSVLAYGTAVRLRPKGPGE
jgi:uncharacterized protein YbjQ (UPF0145 family)